jgi:large repetitive protein
VAATAPDTFTYTLDGGSTATVSTTVTCVDDGPLTSASGTLAYDENPPATAIVPLLAATDIDSSNLTGATVQITGG